MQMRLGYAGCVHHFRKQASGREGNRNAGIRAPCVLRIGFPCEIILLLEGKARKAARIRFGIENKGPNYYGNYQYRFYSLFNDARGAWSYDKKEAINDGKIHQELITKLLKL